MGRNVAASCLLLLSSASAPACASLTGLDQITESACAPSCGADGSTEDVAPGAETEAAEDGASPALSDGQVDTAVESADQSASDGPAPDGWTRDAGVDAVSESGDVDSGAADSTSDSVLPPDASEGGTCGTVYFQDAFEDNSRGWTLDPSWSIAPTCASPPAPQKGNPDPSVDHTSGVAGGIAGAFVCGNNPAKQKSAVRYATSPAIDVSAAPAVFLTFYRWLNTDAASYMTSTVDVFDGAAWVNAYTNPAGMVTDAAWTRQQIDVTAHRSAAFRVRFGYAALSTSVYAMSCWNVDDVTVSSAACP